MSEKAKFDEGVSQTLLWEGLSLVVDGGKLRSISFADTEVIRCISAPVRDENWGTLPETTLSQTVEESPEGIVLHRRYDVGGGKLSGEMTARMRAGELEVEMRLTPQTTLKTNRAGFCVLHPLIGVEGQKLIVRHPNDQPTETEFPVLIRPDQPAYNIAGLQHLAGSVTVDIAFEGEVFEMEDQRNWSDASFKTYCRPLALPFPYAMNAGKTVVQKLRAHFTEVDGGGTKSTAIPVARSLVMPEVLLAVEPEWSSKTVPPGCRLLLRTGVGLPWNAQQLADVAASGASVDLECVVPDDVDPKSFLTDIKRILLSASIKPKHVFALPAAYLKSYQPSGPWPLGVSPKDAALAAQEIFAETPVGVGMMTNFTELNRCKPTVSPGQFVTHGNAAIVHEANDMSVWQTLEALPSVFQSARAIGTARSYRLGLCAIAMRSNPYGKALSPNPAGALRTMTDDDPRQATSFAGAYAIAVAALAAQSGAEAVTLAAPTGPFGLTGALGNRPIQAAVSALAALSGEKAEINNTSGLFEIRDGSRIISANASPREQSYELEEKATLWHGIQSSVAEPGNVTLPSGSFLIGIGYSS